MGTAAGGGKSAGGIQAQRQRRRARVGKALSATKSISSLHSHVPQLGRNLAHENVSDSTQRCHPQGTASSPQRPTIHSTATSHLSRQRTSLIRPTRSYVVVAAYTPALSPRVVKHTRPLLTPPHSSLLLAAPISYFEAASRECFSTHLLPVLSASVVK